MRNRLAAYLLSRVEHIKTPSGLKMVPKWLPVIVPKQLKRTTRYNNITGDVLISSGIVAYLGTFMGKYRKDTVSSWIGLMHQNKIPASEEFSLRYVIGEEVTIRQWVIDKLPNDQVSIENALIISKSRRWPLMIDPQLQANQWIRKANSDKKLKILRLSQQGYARFLESAISNGEPVLLENVGELLDPLLDPLLQKAKFKAGNITMIRLGDSTIEYSEDYRSSKTYQIHVYIYIYI